MDRSEVTAEGDRPVEQARRVPSWLPWTVALAVLVVAFLLRPIIGDDPDGAPPEPAPGQATGGDYEQRVGEAVRLAGGGIARVNGLEGDVTPAPGLPQPEAGTRLVRADVEVCAGEDELFVEPSFWVGLGDDDVVHSAHMGVRDFRTFTLPPGGCQRGYVDLALPEDVALRAVLLMDHTRTATAGWAAAGEPDDVAPLDPGIIPAVATISSPAELSTTGSVTLLEIDLGGDPAGGPDAAGGHVRVAAEVCASEQELLAGPTSWFVQLADHRLVPARREGSSMPSEGVAAGTCEDGAVEFAVPGAPPPTAVIYTFGGVYEEARWRVDG